MTDGGFVRTHLPCPDCNSSDGLAENADGSTKCFVCDTFTPKKDSRETPMPRTTAKPSRFPLLKQQIMTAKYEPLVDRGINAMVAQKYGLLREGNNTVCAYYNPEDPAMPAACKIIIPQGDGKKQAEIQGEWRKGGLFGQQLFSKGGKYVTITEGEIDAASVYQMFGNKYPAVSVRNGAQSALKDCQEQYEWLDSFENIIVCFDNDKHGKEAAAKVAELFAGKAKVVKLHHKDANEYLKKAEGAEFVRQWWDAETFTPDGIVCGKDLWSIVSAPVQAPDASYPWKPLNQITYGIRRAELVTVTAGSGLGKSQFVREIFYHILTKSDYKIGGLFLEETTKKTSLSIMSMVVNKPLHLPTIDWNEDGTYSEIIPAGTEEELKEAFDATLGDGRVFLFDHFGSTDADNIVSRCRYIIKAMGCSVLFVDHISIIVSAQSNGDERKAIDEIMTKLRMLVQETNCMMILVSHLKRPDGKGHEEGAATSLAQLRGSGSIAQLSDMVIGLERDAQAEEELDRNTTRVRILKNRFSGETGPVTELLWNRDTGRMVERNKALEAAL
jgi:twinkle protein